LFGKGAGKSYYKRLLPDSKSDFIFAILIEEYGLIGGVVVLLLYLLFYQRIIVLSIKSQDDFPRLLLLGLGSIVMFQALLHMGVSVNLIPVTGQTLPLISKGGSSVWVTSLAFGIIINISHQINNQQNTNNG
jgi:cell division protein FtsW